MLYVGTRKGLFTLEDSGSGWQTSRIDFRGDVVNLVMFDRRDRTLYASLLLGHFGPKLRRSNDDGKTWTECAMPEYPKAADGQEGTSLDEIWALEGTGADSSGGLWCGTIPGGLFRSDDRGESWRLIESLWNQPERANWFGGGKDQPGIHSICVDPRDNNRVTVGVSCGGVWVTEDAGATWKVRAEGMFAEYMPPERADDPSIQDPHLIAHCAANPDVIWSQHHNGIFRSGDGCKSWTSIEAKPSSFGFAVAVNPKDADQAWFVPAVKDECRVPVDNRFVVTRTSDGGESFDVLSTGLPEHEAFHIVFRHALAVDSSGKRLAMGSSTGGLWTSSDSGDSWQCVSNDLPPIYSLRFASN